MKLILFTDGGARGNPGPGAIGVVLKDTGRNVVHEVAKYIGITTNNEAEYKALLEGIHSGLNKGATELECFLDSELIVKQLNGQYKVKNENLKNYYQEIKIMEPKLNKITYTHVPRSQNKEADSLVNQVLDAQKS